MALIRIHESYDKVGVLAGVTFKAMKRGEIPRVGDDQGGLTVVNDVDVIALP